MTLRIIGAGLGRTGTHSLKLALEQLLGAPCHHMVEVIQNPSQVPGWTAAARGEAVEWSEILSGYAAAVDWPAAAFWPEIAEAFPDSIILMSTRDPESWWESASQTIFRGDGPPIPGAGEMIQLILAGRFTPNRQDKDAVLEAFHRHYEHVRRTAPADRLVEWTARDGWGPICEALGVAIPDAPFPRSNTREDWRAREKH
ncbi:MAG: sulfotransferase family protein [Sandaracinaceae bacterium]|nr:sulfotransferase family protein [Sandaracinaceae bacterium]